MGAKASTQVDDREECSSSSLLQTTLALAHPHPPLARLTPTQTNHNTSYSISGRCSQSGSEVSFTEIDVNKVKVKLDKYPKYGYQISDLDHFLTSASMSSPGNIPFILVRRCELLVVKGGSGEGGGRVLLPAGMAVNCLFKKNTWLFVHTPRGQEGYLSSSSAAPLGLLPPQRHCCVPPPPPTHFLPTPTFPLTSQQGRQLKHFYKGDKEIKYFSDYEGDTRKQERRTYVNVPKCREAASVCDIPIGSDRLNEAKSINSVKRQTLLVVTRDFCTGGWSTLAVRQGEVVALVHANVKQWFWVKNKEGKHGFIPAQVAGNGFL